MGEESRRARCCRRGGADRSRRTRNLRVRVQTDEGSLIGSVRLTSGRSIYELLNDERAYLVLFDVTAPDSAERHEDFVAIHKGAIRSVVLDLDQARITAGS